MENLTINELINKYRDLIPTNELEFFQKNTRFKNKKRVIEKLNRKFQRVETTGRGEKLIFQLDGEIQDAVIDKRSIATTNKAVLLLAQNADTIIGKDMIGKVLTSRKWLKEFGFRLFYDNEYELGRKIREISALMDFNVNEYSDSKISLVNYNQPSILEVLNDSKSRDVFSDYILKFYGRLFKSVIDHSHLEMVATWRGVDREDKIFEISSTEILALKSFEEENKDKSRSRFWRRSKIYLDFIKNQFAAKKIWKEYELADCVSDKSSVLSDKEKNECFDITVQMFIKSMTNRELSKNKIPYMYQKTLFFDSDICQEMNDLGLELNIDEDIEFNDVIDFRLIKDRVLVRSLVKIIEIMNPDYKVDMNNYNQAELKWKQEFQRQNQKPIN